MSELFARTHRALWGLWEELKRDFQEGKPNSYTLYLAVLVFAVVGAFVSVFLFDIVDALTSSKPLPVKTLADRWKDFVQGFVTTFLIGFVAVQFLRVTVTRQVEKIEEVTKKNEEVVRQISEARGSGDFSTIENTKAIVTDSLFEANRRRSFRLVRLRCRNTRFFADFDWPLSGEFNLLLGKNGYGKSYILHAIAGLVSDNFNAVSALFPKDERDSNLVLEIEHQRSGTSEAERTEIEFSHDALRTRLGPVPILAIPDLRFIDKSSSRLGVEASEHIVRNGASLFLADQPIQGLVQTMLYQMCLDYLEHGHKTLPSVAMLERVISRLSGAPFQVKSITRVDAQFQINVVAEGIGDYVMPLQRASQGTLSVVAMFGLIERFLRRLYPADPLEDVCGRSAIIIIDELDAHLHPSWQGKIAGLLGETFPNVQFIVSAHSPLVVAGRHENEVAVLRKREDGKFAIDAQTVDFMGSDLDAIVKDIFELETVDENVDTYLALRPRRPTLQVKIKQLESLTSRTPEQETDLANARTELVRIDSAEQNYRRRMQSDDLKQKLQVLTSRNEALEREIAELRTASTAPVASAAGKPAAQAKAGA